MSDSPATPDAFFPAGESLRAWEAGLDRETRRLGEWYFRENRVRLLVSTGGKIEGIVGETTTKPYRTTLTYHPRNHAWIATCDCPVGISCKHAVALALAAMAGGPVERRAEPAPGGAAAGESAFERAATEAVGRTLTRKELWILGQIKQASVALATGEPARTHLEAVLAELTGRDFAASYRIGVELAGDGPKSPIVLLAALVTQLLKNHRPVPAWLRAVLTDSEAREAIENENRTREIDEWTRLLTGGAETGAGAASAADAAEPTRSLRLRLIGDAVFRWEVRDGAGAEWRALSTGERQEVLKTAYEPDAWFTPESARVADLFRRQARSGTQAGEVALTPVGLPAAFGKMMRHPLMRTHAVGKDGEPLPRTEERLVWSFVPVPGRPDKVRPVLSRADGTVAAQPAYSLGDGLYLVGGALQEGPKPLGAYHGFGPGPEIPAAVFENPTVKTTLRASGAKLIESSAAIVVPVVPLLSATLDEYQCAQVRLHAVDTRGRRRLDWSERGWVTRLVAGDPPGAVADADAVYPALNRFRANTAYEHGMVHFPLAQATAENFAEWLESFPDDTVFDFPPELAAFARDPDRADIGVEVDELGRDWFDLKLVVRASDAELSPAEIRLLLAHEGKWVRLPGKGWRRLDAAMSEGARTQIERLGLNPAAPAGETLRFHAAQLGGDKLAGLADAATVAAVRAKAERLAKVDKPALPAGLRATLRPYQEDGYHFLAHLSTNGLGGVLADDMGLGKTLQTLAWLLWLREVKNEECRVQNGVRKTVSKKEPAGFRALIVAPKSVTANWVAECAKFAPGLRAAIHGVDTQAACDRADLVVVNYARLRLASDAFMATAWTAVVLDEGQHIKNPTSQAAECARALKADHRLVLSGTPVENRLLDLWSLFAFAMPGLLGTHASFKRHYDEKKDAGAAGRLADRVRPFLLRRTKAQVATDLPERIEEDLVVELEPKQRKLYDAELKKARAMLLAAKSARDFDQSRFNILSSLLRLRQICCDPRIVSPDLKRGDSAKLDALWELVEPLTQEGHKVLVFSQFTESLDHIGAMLTEEGVPYLKLTGATENRAELVERFQSPDTEKVFLLSLKAAGTGLNLTAASYVVLFDPWWNPAAEAQAIDRTHRIGQKNKVIAYRLLAKNSVEEKIRALQRDKSALAGEILREESLAKVLDVEALRSILAG